MTPGLIRLVLAGLTAFGAAWASLSMTSGLLTAEKPSVAPQPAGPRWGPSFGFRLSCRNMRFNGTPTLAARWRFRETPDVAMERLAADLVSLKNMEGRELFPGLALTPEDRQAWKEKRLFLTGLAGSAGDSRRMAWREPAGDGSTLVEVLIRAEGTGSEAIWTERQETAWMPDGGPCPGREPEGLALPAGWKRIYCIDGGGEAGSLLNCYAAGTTPSAALDALDAAFRSGGWMPAGMPLARPHGTSSRSYVKASHQCLASAAAGRDGCEITLAQRPALRRP